MSKKTIPVACVLFFITCAMHAFDFKGRVVEKVESSPVAMAVVKVANTEQWAVTDEKGWFQLRNISGKECQIVVSCLGYADASKVITSKDKDIVITLAQDNLALETAVVTARENSSSATTRRTIDKTAMEHLQMLDVSDISSLLPGGKSISPDLTGTDNKFAVRGSSFGTAVEIDGVRLSSNSSFAETSGVSTKSIATTNIEAVEVITGVPSVEYGDLGSGIVKIRTKMGKTPLNVSMMTNPKTKQIALSKGIGLGKGLGVLNLSAERTRSIRTLASPYTSYQRNMVSATWSNTFNKEGMPVRLSAGITGNIGGMDSEADPDASRNTYSRSRDNSLRGNLEVNWMLNKPFITGLNFKVSGNIADNLSAVNTNKSAATSTSAQHGKEEGYFVAQDYSEDAPIVLIPSGYWYQLSYTDSRPLNWAADLKANLSRSFGSVSSSTKLGASLTGNKNNGRGLYYDDPRLAPQWREYRYSDIPMMLNLAAFLEESLTVPVGTAKLQMIGGLRSEMTKVGGSDYGTVSSLSPRVNAKLTLSRKLSFRASWGVATKLPSFNILYPEPKYTDMLCFTPGTLADGSVYYAYYIRPETLLYNPGLKWQQTRMAEIGAELSTKVVNVSLSAYCNRVHDTYKQVPVYDVFDYKFTDQKGLTSVTIPAVDRNYSIDRNTGIVTVSDKNGILPSQTVPYKERRGYVSSSKPVNGDPSTRAGVEMVLDFAKIKALATSFRLDGSYSFSRSLDTVESPYYPGTRLSDGSHFPYLAYFCGGSSYSNGSVSQRVDMNLTMITHIPQIRMIFSLKLESGLWTWSRAISESPDGPRSYAMSDLSDYSLSDTDIYDRNLYSITLPDYYVSYDNLSEKIPFREKFIWAKDNDPVLYSQLKQLCARSDYGYSMNSRTLSPYYSANISITKEIGNHVSLSFYANNFVQNLGSVRSSQNDNDISLFGYSLIPEFYYGMTLRIKL